MFNDKYKKAVEQDCAIIRLDLGGGVCVYTQCRCKLFSTFYCKRYNDTIEWFYNV